LQFHLIEQALGALRSRAEQLAPELGDLQPILRDPSLIVGQARMGGSKFCLGLIRPRLGRGERDPERRDLLRPGRGGSGNGQSES
jgi:hypothetical protein